MYVHVCVCVCVCVCVYVCMCVCVWMPCVPLSTYLSLPPPSFFLSVSLTHIGARCGVKKGRETHRQNAGDSERETERETD